MLYSNFFSQFTFHENSFSEEKKGCFVTGAQKYYVNFIVINEQICHSNLSFLIFQHIPFLVKNYHD